MTENLLLLRGRGPFSIFSSMMPDPVNSYVLLWWWKGWICCFHYTWLHSTHKHIALHGRSYLVKSCEDIQKFFSALFSIYPSITCIHAHSQKLHIPYSCYLRHSCTMKPMHLLSRCLAVNWYHPGNEFWGRPCGWHKAQLWTQLHPPKPVDLNL